MDNLVHRNKIKLEKESSISKIQYTEVHVRVKQWHVLG